MNELQEHRLARTHRITSSRIGTIATGNFKAWNTLAHNMRNASPAPVRSVRMSGVPSLDWGHKNEDWLCAQFWLRHPEYDMHDERWCWWHDPANKVMWQMCGTSPDRTLWQPVDGWDQRVSGLEAKNPYDPRIHRDYREIGDLPIEYKAQVFWHIIVSDAPNWWFVSGDPRETEGRDYFELLVERDPGYEASMLHKVHRFIGGYLRGEEFQATEYNRATYEDIF